MKDESRRKLAYNPLLPMKVIGKALKKRYKMPRTTEVHRFSKTAIGCVARITASKPLAVSCRTQYHGKGHLDILKGVLMLTARVCIKLRSLRSTGAYSS
jgi:hypothetical protein